MNNRMRGNSKPEATDILHSSRKLVADVGWLLGVDASGRPTGPDTLPVLVGSDRDDLLPIPRFDVVASAAAAR